METLPSDDLAVNIELARFAEYEFVHELVAERQPGDAGVGGEAQIVENRRDTIVAYRDLYRKHPAAYRRATAATNLLAFLLDEESEGKSGDGTPVSHPPNRRNPERRDHRQQQL